MGLVVLDEAAHQHLDDDHQRHGEDEPGQPEGKPEAEDGQEDLQRMEPAGASHPDRREVQGLGLLDGGEQHGDDSQASPGRPGEPRQGQGGEQGRPVGRVGHDVGDPRHEAEQPGVRGPGQPEGEALEDGHDQGHRDLAADVAAQPQVDLSDRGPDPGSMPRRHQPVQPLQELRPLSQEVVDQHGHQQEGHRLEGERERTGACPQHTLQEHRGVELAEGPPDPLHDPGVGIHPRLPAVLHGLPPGGEALHQPVGLVDQEGNRQAQEQAEQGQGPQDHQEGRPPTPDPAGQELDHRHLEVGQDHREEEGRQGAPQQPDRQHQPDPDGEREDRDAGPDRRQAHWGSVRWTVARKK